MLVVIIKMEKAADGAAHAQSDFSMETSTRVRLVSSYEK